MFEEDKEFVNKLCKKLIDRGIHPADVTEIHDVLLDLIEQEASAIEFTPDFDGPSIH